MNPRAGTLRSTIFFYRRYCWSEVSIFALGFSGAHALSPALALLVALLELSAAQVHPSHDSVESVVFGSASRASYRIRLEKP